MKIKNQFLILAVSGWVLSFLVISPSSSLAQSGSTGTENDTNSKLISWWSFDAEKGHSAYDEIQQKTIKLDGFRTFIKRDRYNISKLEGAFTVEGWIALASYPWFWSPVVDCSFERLKGFFFGIDSEGHVGFKTGAGNTWVELTTKINIPLREWTHVAAVWRRRSAVNIPPLMSCLFRH